MSYNWTTNFIKTRSTIGENKQPEFIVQGYAAIPNKKDLYHYEKNEDGTTTSFKSLFTEDCIKDMEHQAQYKKMFVDTSHKSVTNHGVLKILSDLGADEEAMKDVEARLDFTQLPIAKINSFKVDDKGFFIDTRLNPSFKALDEKHSKYFDAVWYSLKNKFLNGISINFTPISAKDEFIDGEWVQKIDKVDLYGFSYVDAPALPENNILSVSMRSMQSFKTGGRKMDENKDEKTVPAQQGVDPKVVEGKDQEIQALKAKLETHEKEKVEKEKAEHEQDMKGVKERMDTALDRIDKLEKEKEEILNKPVSQEAVHQASKFYAGEKTGNPILDGKSFTNEANKLHLGEWIALQSEFETHKNVDPETLKHLGRNKADIVLSAKQK